MKVGCQQCGATYSVADEKVAGRRLKLRCKKCGEPMVIDGSAESSVEDSSPFAANIQVVTAAAPESEWFVASEDNAQGPYTLSEVQSHFNDGLITSDTLVYREGFAGWTAAGEVAELQSPAARRSSVPPPPPIARAPRASVPPVALDREVSMGRDPFGDSAPPSTPRVAAGDLFAPGVQRDGTVQFSLDDIRALSAVSAPSSITPPAPVRSGYASGDGSGLIDVRSLSEASAAEAYPPMGGMQGSPLDTMAPFALPVGAHGSGVDFRTKVLAGVASFGFLLAGAIGVFAITRAPQPSAVPAAAASQAAPAQPVAAANAVQPSEALPNVAAAVEPPAQAAAKDEAAAEPVAADSSARGDKPRKRGVRRAPARGAEPERASSKPSRGTDIDDLLASAPVKEKAKAKEEPSAAPAKGGDDIDSLLLGAINGKKAAPKPEPAAESALPKTPTREQMLAALGRAKNKAGKCKGPGVATANIKIAGSGRVSSVSVSGVEGGAKSCVESAVRSTPFPKFQQDSFGVTFPFKLGA